MQKGKVKNCSTRVYSVLRRGATTGKRVAVAALAAWLAACTQVPLPALWQLRTFDFETFDPAELRLAVSLPSNVALWPEGLRLDVKLSRDGAEAPVEESFWFREQSVAVADAALPASATGRSPWVVLQLSPRDSDRLRQWRQQLVASKAAEGEGKAKSRSKLELKVDPRACLRGGALSPSATVSVALRWQAEPGYVVVLRDRSLADLGESLGAAAAQGMPPCKVAAQARG
jgi:hypothetical protein